jgi:hypothetical protein
MKAAPPLVLALDMGDADEASINHQEPLGWRRPSRMRLQALYHMVVHACTDDRCAGAQTERRQAGPLGAAGTETLAQG